MKYQIKQNVDAWKAYWAYIEADSPEEALLIAKSSSSVKWIEGDIHEFDYSEYEAFDPEGDPNEPLARSTT